MGAGHGYSYSNFMLIDEDVVLGTNKKINFLDELDGLPIEEQKKKMIDRFFDGVDDDEEFYSRYEDRILTIQNNKDGNEYESLDIDRLKDNIYEEDKQYLFEAFNEAVFSIAKEINNNIKYDDDYNYSEKLSNVASLEIKNKFETRADIKIAFIADGYNAGIVTYIEDAQGNYYTEDDDFNWNYIAIADGFQGYEDALESITNDEDWLDNYETLTDIVGYIYDSGDEKLLLQDDKEAMNIYNEIIGNMDENFIEKVNHSEELQEKYNRYALKLSHTIHNTIKREAQNLQSQYQNFTDHFFNKLVQTYDEGAFRYPTSAWTSESYKKDKGYGDNESIKSQYIKNSIVQVNNPYSKDYCQVPETDTDNNKDKDTDKNKSTRKNR